MAKRFTDTEKWKDEWFLELEPTMKIFWIYLCDTCDNAGFWKENFKHASFFVGTIMDRQSTLRALGDRVKVLPSKKWFINKFISFQYGDALYENNPAHKSVIHLLNFEGMTDEVEILPEAGGHTRKRIGRSAKERIFHEAGFTCEYCGIRPEIKELVIDHIIPVAKGGTNSNANLACACVSCNAKKSAVDLNDFLCKYDLEPTASKKIKLLIAPFKKLKAPINSLLAPLDKDKDMDKEMDSSFYKKEKEPEKNLPEVLPQDFRNPKDSVTPDNVIQLFNDKCAGKGKISFCRGLSSKNIEDFKVTISYQDFKKLKTWAELFTKTASSMFLTGQSNRSFVATLDWLVIHDNALKVLNGKYDKSEAENVTSVKFGSKNESSITEDKIIRAKELGII